MVEAALDAALMSEVVVLRGEERFPGPGENVRVVAADLQDFGVRQPVARVAALEERVEGFGAPCLQGVQDASGVADLGVKGVVEEVLQIPAQLLQQVGVRLAFNGELVGRRYLYQCGGLTVT